ncbi:hypothetical protein M378DRAFT_173153, partial [Amanita muscaria Koide BX008]
MDDDMITTFKPPATRSHQISLDWRFKTITVAASDCFNFQDVDLQENINLMDDDTMY